MHDYREAAVDTTWLGRCPGATAPPAARLAPHALVRVTVASELGRVSRVILV